jgi:hypothetical protein
MESQTNMTKLITVVRSFANALKNGKRERQNTVVYNGNTAKNETKSKACSWVVNFGRN